MWCKSTNHFQFFSLIPGGLNSDCLCAMEQRLRVWFSMVSVGMGETIMQIANCNKNELW